MNAVNRIGLAGFILLLVLSLSFALPGNVPPKESFWVAYPTPALPLREWIDTGSAWIVSHFIDFTRAISWLFSFPLDVSAAILAKGIPLTDDVAVPPLSWLGLVLAMGFLGYAICDLRLALLQGACFLYLAIFGQWSSAMLTLASVLVCVPVAVLAGLALGVGAYKAPLLDRFFITPLLDLMQTVPAFAYLIPVLFLFGFGPVAALMATMIFALPPMARATSLALTQTPPDIHDFAEMIGCTQWQKLIRVQLPVGRPLVMVGVNQVVMLTLNMVIIASVIGAGGLGYDVLQALRSNKIGVALEAGLAIVALAIALDRLTEAAANPAARWKPKPAIMAAAILVALTALSLFLPALSLPPTAITVTTASFWDTLAGWININFFDYTEAFRVFLLLNIINPVKLFMLKLPWPFFIALGGFLGLALGGWRLAMLAILAISFAVFSGLWEKTIVTLYLCGLSALIACLIGIPLGIWATRSNQAEKILIASVDTLQTLPAFVYLMPAVMLFRVGDVTAMMAVILFAIAPVIRYTNLGIRELPANVLEAAKMAGCNPFQILWRIQLPLASPQIMLGINQAILLALSMLVITALVGTRDLGQEVYIALTKAKVGQGLVPGLIIALIGIVIDRMLRAASQGLNSQLGLQNKSA